MFSLLSCQAFVTSSGFHGQAIPFLRHRGGAATPLSADGNTNNKDSNKRIVGPLGVLRSPPTSARRSTGRSSGGGGANEENDKEGLRGGRSASRTDKKQVVQVSAKRLYRNDSNKSQSQSPTQPNNNNKENSTPCGTPAFMSSQHVEYVAETKLPTDIGAFQLRGYKIPGAPLGQEPCVIYSRDKPPFGKDGAPAVGVPVRIHDQCLTSEVFRSQR
jgi:hypothetical protein